MATRIFVAQLRPQTVNCLALARFACAASSWEVESESKSESQIAKAEPTTGEQMHLFN